MSVKRHSLDPNKWETPGLRAAYREMRKRADIPARELNTLAEIRRRKQGFKEQGLKKGIFLAIEAPEVPEGYEVAVPAQDALTIGMNLIAFADAQLELTMEGEHLPDAP